MKDKILNLVAGATEPPVHLRLVPKDDQPQPLSASVSNELSPQFAQIEDQEWEFPLLDD